MNTLILAVSLFTTQSGMPNVETQWFDTQAMRAHLVSYLSDDRQRVSSVLSSTLSEGIQLGSKLNELRVADTNSGRQTESATNAEPLHLVNTDIGEVQ